MTRRDYVLLSDALRKAKAEAANYPARYYGWVLAVREVAFALAERNPQFDQPRFMRDAGVEQ